MPRKPRIEHPGAFYHLMCRGNNGEEVSLTDILRRTKNQKYSDVRKAIVRLSEKYSDIANKELA